LVNKFNKPPHTDAKHRILDLYLKRWFPILSHRGQGLAYVDGFAGPGIYSRGEPGSPIIALRAANMYSGRKGFSARFWFIEPRRKHHQSLMEQIQKVSLMNGVHIEGTLRSTFEETFPEIIACLQKEGSMPPTFAFVDPDGYSDVTMRTLTDFLRLEHCEFLFTFMENPLKRFIGLKEEARKKKLDRLFGTGKWRAAIVLKGSERTQFLLDLYTKQLRSNGVKYTQAFEMRDKHENTIYHLVFATNIKYGLEVMKEEMVKVDPKFTFSVSDVMVPGQMLILNSTQNDWYGRASDLIFQRYSGQCDVPLVDVKCFVTTDTPYVYKPGIIKLMKKLGLIVNKVKYAPMEKMDDALKYRVTFVKSRTPCTLLDFG